MEKIEFVGKELYRKGQAILFQEETKEKSEAVWLPLSQINILNEDSKTGEIEIEIPEWIARKEELI